MRGGNFFYRLSLPGAILVHRGVSQGGRKLLAETRKVFWQRNSRTVQGVEIASDGTVKISVQGLREMRQLSLVLVVQPSKPRVHTAARILKSAEKIQEFAIGSGTGQATRHGGLKL
ncbi:MAG: hypothetical protein PHU73_03050 [Patescibacteria group bacterium]|nr:hypothetical protein [Patescibacteria group bacterium]